MIAGRARILSATLLGLGLLIPLSVVPATAATCALSAPATVNVGTPLAIVGSGFPASTSIDISIGLEGATPDEFTVQSDGAGAFQISLTPEPADAGKTTVVATAGTTCSAQAVFTVTGATATPTPRATATPTPGATATPTPGATATPKPGATATPEATTPPSGSGADATGNPPRTDAALSTVGQTADVPTIGWTLALLILLIGLGGVLATRRTSDR